MHRIVSDCQNTRIYMYHLVSMILDGIICNDDVITAGVDTTRSRYEVQMQNDVLAKYSLAREYFSVKY